MINIHDQIEDVPGWLAKTDRNFQVGDRVVHLYKGHNGRSSCPARGVLVNESFWRGCFEVLIDGEPKGSSFYPDMSHLVKESDFDALNLVAVIVPVFVV